MTDVGYDAFDDPYCYKGTRVLRNKAGLGNAEDELRNQPTLPLVATP